MHISYVFILQFLVQLYMFLTTISFVIRSFVVCCIYSCVQTVQTCLDTFANTANHETPDDERNGR